MSIDNAALRQFILQFFSDEELETLCFDYFPEVKQNFTGGMTKNRKALLLIAYCETRDRLADLYGALARERETAWNRAFGAAPVEKPSFSEETRFLEMRDPRQVFLSHATADAAFAHQLAGDLRAEGWGVWIAPESIRPGEKWVEAIERGLETSGIFVVALTRAAVASRWVRTETNAALALEHSDLLRFLPLDVDECAVPLLWSGYQFTSFRRSYEAGLADLLGLLDGEPAAPVETGRRPVSTTSPDRRIHEKTRIELIRIPAGPFLYGSSDADKMAHDDEKPQRTVELPEYWIGRAPVTNGQFARFVQATGHRTTAEHEGFGWGWTGSKWDKIQGADWQHPRGPESSIAGKEGHPVVQVSWDDARAFCDWAGLALPTEEQWEKAARGTDGRVWPWGNEPPTAGHCNFGMKVGDTTPVGKYSPQGDSPYGCVDMAGNVWEWTGSWYSEGRTRALRGGAWYYDDQNTRAAYRNDGYPHLRVINVGFRVVELLSDPGF